MHYRKGFTLIEALIVIVIVGVLLSVTVPRYGVMTSAMGVRSANQTIGAMLAQGRATAIRTGRTVLFVRSANLVSLLTTDGTTPVTIAQQDLGSQFGVTVSATKDTVSYDPRGLVAGNSMTLKFVVTDGITRDSVCVMALGKVSLTGCSL